MFDLGDFFAQTERNPHTPHLILQRFGDLIVKKTQHLVPAFDERHLHPQGRQHAGVFDADHPPADHDHRLGNVIEFEQFIGGENRSCCRKARNPAGPVAYRWQ